MSQLSLEAVLSLCCWHMGLILLFCSDCQIPCHGITSTTQQEAITGHNVSLNCFFPVSSGEGTMKFLWYFANSTVCSPIYRQNQRLCSGCETWMWVDEAGLALGNATLHLADVTVSNVGNYSCWVSFGYDCQVTEVELLVQGTCMGLREGSVLACTQQ